MSQSATLYRITDENFQIIKKMEARQIKPSAFAAGEVSFQGSFTGLEFVLSKGLDEDGRELISEVFNPLHFIGPTDTNVFNLDEDEEEFDEMAIAAGYLAPGKVKRAYALLSQISDLQVLDNFDAEELNENDIYPGSWHTNEAADVAFSRQQIREDFGAIRDFFHAAAENEQYVLSYVG